MTTTPWLPFWLAVPLFAQGPRQGHGLEKLLPKMSDAPQLKAEAEKEIGKLKKDLGKE